MQVGRAASAYANPCLSQSFENVTFERFTADADNRMLEVNQDREAVDILQTLERKLFGWLRRTFACRKDK